MINVDASLTRQIAFRAQNKNLPIYSPPLALPPLLAYIPESAFDPMENLTLIELTRAAHERSL